MSYVNSPLEMPAAGAQLPGIDTTVTARVGATAVQPTLAPAAADEVSALIALQLGADGALFRAVNAQAAAAREMLGHILGASADVRDATGSADPHTAT